MRGRVNILGAFDFGTTRQIYEYLHRLFQGYHAELIVPEGIIPVCKPREPLVYNIPECRAEEAARILSDFDTWQPPILGRALLPAISEQDHDAALTYIDQMYNEQMSTANEFLLEWFAGTFIGELLRD